MFVVSTLQTALNGLIGFRQNEDPDGWQLTDLTSSSSGYYFNDIHPMITFDNIQSIAKDFDLIHRDGNGDVDPAARNAAFTTWLQNKINASYIRALAQWINTKVILKTAENLLSDNLLFTGTGNITDLVPTGTQLVGHIITPTRSKNLLMTINRVGLHFTANQTITLYLFKTGEKQPLETEPLEYTEQDSVQWFDVNWQLKGEGSYYVCYSQSAISGQAINGVRNFNDLEAGLTEFPTGRYYRAKAFSAEVSAPIELWDSSLNNYTVATNYGINLDSKVECDYTDFIIRHKGKFVELLATRVAMDLMRFMVFTPETNPSRHERNMVKNQAALLNEIDGTPGDYKKTSLDAQYKLALQSIQFDKNKIDPVCLTCKKRGIQITSIGPMGSL